MSVQRIAEKIEYFEPWREFKTPLVRQLAFTVASPNILYATPTELNIKHHFNWHNHEKWQQHFQHYVPRLKQLDRAPLALENFLNTLKSTRLGLRFETLMWFWLTESDYHAYELIGHSLQQREGRNTLGELDFLLKNTETKRIEHWEVALKYYLAEADYQLPHWFGLNRTDTLSKKLQHFTNKQFQFKQVNDHVIEDHFAVMKGQLYLPQQLAHPVPTWINPQRRTGIWGHCILPDYYRLQRHEWICPHVCPSSSPAQWWTNGLYHHTKLLQDYMFRIDNNLQNSTKFNQL